MAFSLKITATTPSGESLRVEPRWWDKQELQRTHSFVSKRTHGYQDFILDVTKDQLIQISAGQEEYLDKGIFADPLWVKNNNETKKELDKFIQAVTEESLIQIVIYEWETGFD